MKASAPGDPNPAHTQRAYRLGFDWGPTGAEAIGSGADVAVVVDVLSFTTTVTIAVDRGIEVLPYRWRDSSAGEYAAAHDAVLAAGRREGLAEGRVSLSPASLVTATGIERLVLPSPNGSTISALLAGCGAAVVAASLRNATAVAAWLGPRVMAGGTVAVLAAGERWPDGSLRPAVEDLWGAGAVIAALAARLPGALGPDSEVLGAVSPEAAAAAAAYAAVRQDIAAHLRASASGRELIDAGFGADVEFAAEADRSLAVPVLTGDAFRDSASGC